MPLFQVNNSNASNFRLFTFNFFMKVMVAGMWILIFYLQLYVKFFLHFTFVFTFNFFMKVMVAGMWILIFYLQLYVKFFLHFTFVFILVYLLKLAILNFVVILTIIVFARLFTIQLYVTKVIIK